MAADDTTSDYGAVLPLPTAPGAGLGEAILSRLVVAQGLATREQLRALLSRRASGDLRPLEALLLEAGLVRPADLEGLRALAVGAGTDPLTPSAGVPVRPGRPATPGAGVPGVPGASAPPAPSAPLPTPAGGVPRGWGAAAASAPSDTSASTDVDVEAAAERTVEFGAVLAPAPLSAPAAPVETPAVAPGPPAEAMPGDPVVVDPERPFSISHMEWGRGRQAPASGAAAEAVDESSSSGERAVHLDRLRRTGRRAGPSAWLTPLLLTGLAALVGLAGVRLLAWSRAERRAAWQARVDVALARVLEGDGGAVLAALPAELAPDDAPELRARRALAEGAGLILRGDVGPGLVALEQGAPALATLDGEVERALQRLRARALIDRGRAPDAVALLEGLAARAPQDAAAQALLAEAAERLGRHDEAARRFEAAAAAIDDEARRARLLRRAVDLALAAGEPARALAALERVGGRPGAERLVLRGDVCFTLGRLDAARDAYEAALGAQPAAPGDLAAARLGLARAALVEGEAARAREQLDALTAAPELEPERQRLRAVVACAIGRPLDALALLARLTDPDAALLAADAQLSLGDARAALAALEGHEQAGDAQRLALALRARAHLLEGDLDAAREHVDLLRRAAPGAPGSARPTVRVLGGVALTGADLAALDAELMGELALAASSRPSDEARAALAAAAGSARARLTLGRLERAAGDVAAARAALVDAAALAPRDPTPPLELARVELQRGALDAARAALDEALERDPSLPGARLLRAELRLRLGDPAGAADDLRRCHGAVDPLRRLVVEARVAASAGDMDAAAERWEAALRLDPDDPRLVSEAARACAVAGRLERAERLLERLADLDPDDPEVHAARARVLLERDEPAAALEAATRAVALAPSPAAHVLRAQALLRLGRPGEARAALDEAARQGETADTLVTRALVDVHEATPATADARAASARQLLDRTLALDLTASLPALLCREGRRHADAGRPLAAELSFRLALERDRRFLEAHHGLVRLLVARGDWKAVSDAAGRLLAEDPDDAMGREAVAEAQRRLGR